MKWQVVYFLLGSILFPRIQSTSLEDIFGIEDLSRYVSSFISTGDVEQLSKSSRRFQNGFSTFPENETLTTTLRRVRISCSNLRMKKEENWIEIDNPNEECLSIIPRLGRIERKIFIRYTDKELFERTAVYLQRGWRVKTTFFPSEERARKVQAVEAKYLNGKVMTMLLMKSDVTIVRWEIRKNGWLAGLKEMKEMLDKNMTKQLKLFGLTIVEEISQELKEMIVQVVNHPHFHAEEMEIEGKGSSLFSFLGREVLLPKKRKSLVTLRGYTLKEEEVNLVCQLMEKTEVEWKDIILHFKGRVPLRPLAESMTKNGTRRIKESWILQTQDLHDFFIALAGKSLSVFPPKTVFLFKETLSPEAEQAVEEITAQLPSRHGDFFIRQALGRMNSLPIVKGVFRRHRHPNCRRSVHLNLERTKVDNDTVDLLIAHSHQLHYVRLGEGDIEIPLLIKLLSHIQKEKKKRIIVDLVGSSWVFCDDHDLVVFSDYLRYAKNTFPLLHLCDSISKTALLYYFSTLQGLMNDTALAIKMQPLLNSMMKERISVSPWIVPPLVALLFHPRSRLPSTWTITSSFHCELAKEWAMMHPPSSKKIDLQVMHPCDLVITPLAKNPSSLSSLSFLFQHWNLLEQFLRKLQGKVHLILYCFSISLENIDVPLIILELLMNHARKKLHSLSLHFSHMSILSPLAFLLAPGHSVSLHITLDNFCTHDIPMLENFFLQHRPPLVSFTILQFSSHYPYQHSLLLESFFRQFHSFFPSLHFVRIGYHSFFLPSVAIPKHKPSSLRWWSWFTKKKKKFLK